MKQQTLFIILPRHILIFINDYIPETSSFIAQHGIKVTQQIIDLTGVARNEIQILT